MVFWLIANQGFRTTSIDYSDLRIYLSKFGNTWFLPNKVLSSTLADAHPIDIWNSNNELIFSNRSNTQTLPKEVIEAWVHGSGKSFRDATRYFAIRVRSKGEERVVRVSSPTSKG